MTKWVGPRHFRLSSTKSPSKFKSFFWTTENSKRSCTWRPWSGCLTCLSINPGLVQLAKIEPYRSGCEYIIHNRFQIAYAVFSRTPCYTPHWMYVAEVSLISQSMLCTFDHQINQTDVFNQTFSIKLLSNGILYRWSGHANDLCVNAPTLGVCD